MASSMVLVAVLLVATIVRCDDMDNTVFSDGEVDDPPVRVERESDLTQHLNPPVSIDPIPLGPRVTMPHISFRDMAGFVNQAVQEVDERFNTVEPAIFNSKNARQEPGKPAWFMAASHKTKVAAKNMSRIALISEHAARFIAQTFRLNKDQVTYGLPTADVRGTILGQQCPVEVDFPCQPRKYRAYNGYCNNVQNPKWGNSLTRYLRFLPADYADGVSVPRQATSGQFLPSPREVSLVVHREVDSPHAHMTLLTAMFGMFVYHDISHTPQMAGYLGQRLKCCGINFNEFHPECYPIRLPDNDPVHSKFREKCQEYVRSGTAPRTGCTLGPREQVNQVTAFLDSSTLYGSSREEVQELRAYRGGLLKTQRGPTRFKEILQEDENLVDCRSNGQQRCFKSGDVRVNENIGLTLMHTLWVREHNRVARRLARVNSHWNDEQLFQETRRIVGAEIQHITYNELLPIILGEGIVDKYGLRSQASGYFTGYDININAGIANSVASSAMQFIMSLMPNIMQYITPDGRVSSEQDITETFYSPFELKQPEKLDKLLMGLLNMPAQNEDSFIASSMTNRLFKDPKTGVGLDVAAQILQQGRDHGLAGYTKWRQFCGLKPARSFEDLADVMSRDSIAAFKRIYKHVDDIDLFSGGLAEFPNRGAVVGPTFGCLIGRQFHYLRRGDRYWYENDLPPSSLSKDQLNEIRKVSFARIICDNSDIIVNVQPQGLLRQDPFLNAVMACQARTIKRVNLDRWTTASPNFVVPNQVLSDSISRAKRDLHSKINNEFDTFNSGRFAHPQSPVGSSYGFLRPKRQAQRVSNTSFVLQFATSRFTKHFFQNDLNQQLKDSEGGSVPPQDLDELMNALPNVDVSDHMDIPNIFDCDEQTLPCDHTTKYRTITGWCNNLNIPEYGKTVRAFARLLRPVYDDGIHSPRQRSRTGAPLPSPRLISANIHNDVSAPHVRYSLFIMQFGQFLDHDITFTPVNKGFGESILDCRDCDSGTNVHPECLPIPLPPNDPFYPPVNITSGRPICLPFTRSMPGQLTLGYREQMNQVTAFVDGSAVYGSDLCEMRVLRTYQGGRMITTPNAAGGKELLPLTSEIEECKSPTGRCFAAGDNRNSEQPALAAIHTIWMREHNRIVTELARINPHWSDDGLFYNARRILGSVFQHTTYNEFLPRVLGWNAINLYELKVEPEGFFYGYDQHCNPTMLNEFGTAAFRFGHSLLKPAIIRMDNSYARREPSLRLRDKFFKPDDLLQPLMIDQIMRGLTSSSMETLDQFLTEEVTNHLFEDERKPYSGLDLAALNIQRGRDHGVPGYNNYRHLCNLTRAQDFGDLSREVAPPIIERLSRTYAHVDDIDLFTGGLAETPLHGGLVGPTFACIIGIQFRQLKKCDRFWYENGDPLVRYTEAQLTEIRKMTIAKVLCENCDNVDTIQRSAFDLPDPFLNPRVPCRSLPTIDLSLWKERVSCTVGRTTIDVAQATRISPCVMCTCTKEGPACQSLKIDNCFRLAQSFKPDDILNDHVCKVQCAFAFRSFPQVGQTSNNQLGFS